MEKKELIKKLEERRNILFGELFESNKVYILEVIFSMVVELRSINKLIKYLNE